jgi:hypothetical protein
MRRWVIASQVLTRAIQLPGSMFAPGSLSMPHPDNAAKEAASSWK